MFNECFLTGSWSFFLLETPCHPTTPCSTKRCTCWLYLLVVNIHKCHNYSNHSVPCALDNGHCYFLASQGFIKILIKTNKRNWNISIFVLWRSCLSCQHMTSHWLSGWKKRDMTSVQHAALAGTQASKPFSSPAIFSNWEPGTQPKLAHAYYDFSALKARGSMLADSRLS